MHGRAPPSRSMSALVCTARGKPGSCRKSHIHLHLAGLTCVYRGAVEAVALQMLYDYKCHQPRPEADGLCTLATSEKPRAPHRAGFYTNQLANGGREFYGVLRPLPKCCMFESGGSGSSVVQAGSEGRGGGGRQRSPLAATVPPAEPHGAHGWAPVASGREPKRDPFHANPCGDPPF